MKIQAKYVHTNLVAEDWRGLARFYQEVFGCVVLRRVLALLCRGE
jgi:predicted enzyme related to lactoylglutathione lyase